MTTQPNKQPNQNRNNDNAKKEDKDQSGHSTRSEAGKKAAETTGHEKLSEAGRKGEQHSHQGSQEKSSSSRNCDEK